MTSRVLLQSNVSHSSPLQLHAHSLLGLLPSMSEDASTGFCTNRKFIFCLHPTPEHLCHLRPHHPHGHSRYRPQGHASILCAPPSCTQPATSSSWFLLLDISGPALLSIPNSHGPSPGVSVMFPCFYCGPFQLYIFAAPA